MGHPAMAPNWIPSAANAGTARSLLPPGLFPSTADEGAVLNGMSSLSQAVQIMLYRSMQKTFVHFSRKDPVVQVKFAHNFVIQVLDFEF